MSELKKALQAVRGFIEEWKIVNKSDEIYGLHTGCDREQALKVSDLELICYATYNPATHILISKDKVPQLGALEAFNKYIGRNALSAHLDPVEDAQIVKTFYKFVPAIRAALIAEKMEKTNDEIK